MIRILLFILIWPMYHDTIDRHVPVCAYIYEVAELNMAVKRQYVAPDAPKPKAGTIYPVTRKASVTSRITLMLYRYYVDTYGAWLASPSLIIQQNNKYK